MLSTLSRRRPFSRFAAAVLAGTLAISTLSVTATDALAQPKDNKKKQEELRPPLPPQPSGDQPAHYMGLLIMLVGIGLVVGINLIPSKRGHQD